MPFSHLFAGCRPFVRRTFRGRRSAFHLGSSLLFGLLTLMFGLWCGLGTSTFTQDVRRSLGFERYDWDRAHRDYTLVTHDAYSHDNAVRERERVREILASESGFCALVERVGFFGEIDHLVRNADDLLRRAVSHPEGATDPHLLVQARTLWGDCPSTATDRLTYFSWQDPAEVERLRTVVEHSGVPAVEPYASPLSVAGALRLTGVIAGGLAMFFLMVVAPLRAGSELAQEVHDNTLAPICGTQLSSRQIALGFAASGFAVGLLWAAPVLALMLACAAAAGLLAPALAFVVVLFLAASMLTALGLVVGFVLGKKRSPGIVGMLLLAAFGLPLVVAWAWWSQLYPLQQQAVLFIGGWPHLGLDYLLAQTFGPFVDAHGGYSPNLAADGPRGPFRPLVLLALASATYGIFSLVFMRGIGRRLSGRPGPSSTLVEAFTVVALLAVNAALTLDAVLTRSDAHSTLTIATQAALYIPLVLVLLARVPVGQDEHPRLHLGILVLEFVAYFAVLWTVTGIVGGAVPATLRSWSVQPTFATIAWLQFAYASLITVCVVVVMARRTTRWWGQLALCCALGLAACAGISGSIATLAAVDTSGFHGAHLHAMLLLWSTGSPVLGIMQASLMLVALLALWRVLRFQPPLRADCPSPRGPA